MRKLLFELIWTCGFLFWALVYWRARRLSERYNAWTTRLRGRNARLSPPPTPRMLEANTRIMTWIIRGSAIWFALFSLLALAAAAFSK
jgi:hypothetical protein